MTPVLVEAERVVARAVRRERRRHAVELVGVWALFAVSGLMVMLVVGLVAESVAELLR